MYHIVPFIVKKFINFVLLSLLDSFYFKWKLYCYRRKIVMIPKLHFEINFITNSSFTYTGMVLVWVLNKNFTTDNVFFSTLLLVSAPFK